MRREQHTVLAVLAIGAGAAFGQVVNFNVEFSGSINGQPIAASGSGVLDRSGQGENFGSVEFDALPEGFSPFAMDTMLTNVCPNGFQAEGRSANLWDLGGGNYQIERTFQWIGLPGSTIFTTADVTFDADTQTMSSIMQISGNYTGPTDLVAIDSYSVLWLPSSTEGEVFEAGTAVVRRANGESLLVQFATRYFGLRDSLPAVQFGVGDFDADFDGQTLTLGWDGYFAVPAPGAGMALLLAGGLLRRRR